MAASRTKNAPTPRRQSVRRKTTTKSDEIMIALESFAKRFEGLSNMEFFIGLAIAVAFELLCISCAFTLLDILFYWGG